MTLITAECGWCGQTFTGVSNPSKPRRFCSGSCGAKSRWAVTKGDRPEPPTPDATPKRKSGVDVESECLNCGKTFTRRIWASHAARGAKGLYCSRSCVSEHRWKNASPNPLGPRLYVRIPGHPMAMGNGKVLNYRAVLYDAIGPGEHPCHWCGTTVTWITRKGSGHSKGELAVDHLDGDSRNDARDNLVPACNRCNTLRGLIQAWHEDTGLPVSHLGVGLLQA